MLLTPSPSVELLAKGLSNLGYTTEFFVLDETDYACFTAPNGRVWLTPSARISYPFTSSTARQISTYKHHAYELATRHGVTIPRTQFVPNRDYKLADFEAILQSAPLIVKPNSASLSNGLSRDVTTPDELEAALQRAFEFSESAVVQNHVCGEELRFVVIDDVVTASILREAPQVVGDGKQTVDELIAAENKVRRGLAMEYVSYPELTADMISVDTSRRSDILLKGEVLKLGPATMIRDGASMYNVLSEVHPSYVTMAQNLARQLGTGFVVVDIFIEDYHQAMTATNYAFIEFNMSPVLKLFYSCRDGKQYDVLADLVPVIDKAVRSSGSTPA